jgi:hypothetical protein
MKVLNPMMSAGASGSLAGLTVSNSMNGYAFRAKANPTTRYRTPQMGNRSILSYLSVYWSALTQAQRDQWGVWAQSHPRPNGWGGTFIMSGFNAFIHLNQCQMSEFSNAAVKPAPPSIPLTATIATLVAGVGVVSGTISLAFTLLGTGVVTDSIQIQLSTPHMGFGCYDGLKGWHKVMSVAGNAVVATVTSLTPSEVYGVRIRYVNADGQRSNWMQKSFQAHA